jgi:anti-sigma B factor antagonist
LQAIQGINLVDAARGTTYYGRLRFILIPDGAMGTQNRIDVSDVGDVSVVQFKDRKILDESNIQEMGRELFELVEQDRRKILLNFMNVEFLSSAALGKLITLDKKIKTAKSQLKLSNIRPEIYEVFAITRLNKLFDIHEDESDALATF